jgi:hypothetical protein
MITLKSKNAPILNGNDSFVFPNTSYSVRLQEILNTHLINRIKVTIPVPGVNPSGPQRGDEFLKVLTFFVL